jgi:hypothetical protein
MFGFRHSSMDIKDFLLPADALVNVSASDKTRLLQELAARAASALNLDANLISIEPQARTPGFHWDRRRCGDPTCWDSAPGEAVRYIGSSQARYRL